MSKSDPSQGVVADPARPAVTPVAKPDNARQFRTIERGLNKPDAPAKRQPPETAQQNWRKG